MILSIISKEKKKTKNLLRGFKKKALKKKKKKLKMGFMKDRKKL